MSKQTDDLIDRIQGAANALKGVKAKLSPPAPAPAPPDVPPAPNPEVTQEDYDHAKQVVAELKANVEQLEATVSRDSKSPESEASGKGKSEGKTKI